MSESDQRMMRQAMLQTWIDQAQAKRAQQRREWLTLGVVALFCLFVSLSHTLFG